MLISDETPRGHPLVSADEGTDKYKYCTLRPSGTLRLTTKQYEHLRHSPVITAPILAPAAVSTANLVKAAPISVIRTIATPIITAPVVRTVVTAPIAAPGYAPLGLGTLGLAGHGLGSLAVPLGLGH
ncbi:hypothetical protein ACJJTC_007405 [Scirpophaga incertulas]